MTAKVAIVTGASSGIGEATARRLHSMGYTVYAAARRVDRMATLADIGIIPIRNVCESYWNCNPGKLFEYIGAGLPLAVSNLAQLGWYVRSRSLGEVFEPESPRQIASAVTKLAMDFEYRRTCARNAKRIHEDEACWEIQSEYLRNAVLG